MSDNLDASPCQSCGACCAYSSNWPRFTIEEDAALDLIPSELVNDRLSGMRCDGDRCVVVRCDDWGRRCVVVRRFWRHEYRHGHWDCGPHGRVCHWVPGHA